MRHITINCDLKIGCGVVLSLQFEGLEDSSGGEDPWVGPLRAGAKVTDWSSLIDNYYEL